MLTLVSIFEVKSVMKIFNPLHNLRIRFYFFGLIMYCLQALPNLLWLIFPPPNDPLAYNYSPYAWLNALEFLSGSGVVASLILLDSKHLERKRLFLYLALLCLCVYYIAWIYYFLEFATFLVLFSIVLMPPLYFALLALYLQNRIMFVLCVPFGIAHCWISAQGLWIV